MSRPCVLVVEDEPLIQMSIVDELELGGFKVLAAFNAKEAIGLLDRHSEISVIFTDVDMPGSMDGVALAEYVRDRWPPIKIIVTSGYRKIKEDELPEGSPFIPKPYDAESVVNTVRALVDARQYGLN